ncbi:putative NLI interacting factor like phosphatase [Trypanosoma vivax]|nr:putative NLI interacting factor like phosphatase [Trypanosoma vivax]
MKLRTLGERVLCTEFDNVTPRPKPPSALPTRTPIRVPTKSPPRIPPRSPLRIVAKSPTRASNRTPRASSSSIPQLRFKPVVPLRSAVVEDVEGDGMCDYSGESMPSASARDERCPPETLAKGESDSTSGVANGLISADSLCVEDATLKVKRAGKGVRTKAAPSSFVKKKVPLAPLSSTLGDETHKKTKPRVSQGGPVSRSRPSTGDTTGRAPLNVSNEKIVGSISKLRPQTPRPLSTAKSSSSGMQFVTLDIPAAKRRAGKVSQEVAPCTARCYSFPSDKLSLSADSGPRLINSARRPGSGKGSSVGFHVPLAKEVDEEFKERRLSNKTLESSSCVVPSPALPKSTPRDSVRVALATPGSTAAFLRIQKACSEESKRSSAHANFERTSTGLFGDDTLDDPKPENCTRPSQPFLIRSLSSAIERDLTATVVFDLDETLCNNRLNGPALLRPGAVELLKKLRCLFPRHSKQKGTVAANAFDHVPASGDTNGNACSEMGSAAGTRPILDEGTVLHLEIITWTASVEAVARPVIARLDPNGTIFDDVIYRDVRWYNENCYTKDLRRLGRRLDRSVIVENSPMCVVLNRSNAILVNDFVRNRLDRQLYAVFVVLQEWLETLNQMLLQKHFYCLNRLRDSNAQEGGESREPPECAASSTPRGALGTTKITSFNEDLRAACPINAAFVRELEQKASPIYFLEKHPYLSPGTRYVKPSACHLAYKLIHRSPGGAGAGTTGVASTKKTASAHKRVATASLKRPPTTSKTKSPAIYF